MKKIVKILVFSFLTLISTGCKTTKNSENPKENAPKVEFSSYDFGESEFPKQKREVNDFEFVFSVEELEKLTRIIREFEKKTSNQIAIVSIKSIKSYDDFDKYALDLSNNWGVGQKGKDNGLTIVFSKTLRKIRISTGTGTEKFLSDKDCIIIIDETIIPEFKNGNFYDGIEKGLYQLIEKWK
ncbi:TPM domain-containing protein [Flavobacterium sp.]|uniref:TPM domain-containing protein n=1 Tax=Flavobacterium sp. TaxID=239 RepID=UPI003F6A29A2